jgi:type II secretory pathway pseudopilin PulG
MKKPSQNSFTLIELLVVAALISLLSSVLFVGIQRVRSQARDAKREVELSQIKKALEFYYNINGKYPTTTNKWISIEDETDPEAQNFRNSLKPNYISEIPKDPLYQPNGEYSYRYLATTTENYLLCAKRERDQTYYCFSSEIPGSFTLSSLPSGGGGAGGGGGGGGISLFQKTIGGTSYDHGYSIRQTSDEGYVITGTTRSFGAVFTDVFVIKLDSSGNLSWAKTIEGMGYNYGYSIQQTSDGGYVITGETLGDVFVIKLDSSGNLSWAKTIGGPGDDVGYSIQQTSDEGYVITGYTSSFGAGDYDVFVIKLDSSGNLSWAKTIGGPGYDAGSSIQQTSDGGYVITGETQSFGAGNGDVFVIKLDSSGNLSWAKTIGGTSDDRGRSIQQTSDGGYVITGRTYSFGAGGYDVFVIKLDSSGNLSWTKTIGGRDVEWGSSIQQTSDGGYVITGGTYGFGAGDWDVFVIKLDSSGNLSWAKTIGGTNYDAGRSIQQTSDGGYVITGHTLSFGAGSYDVFVIKLDSSGDIPGCSSIGSPSPSVFSLTPSIDSPSPSVSSPTPSVGSPSPTVSSPTPSIDSQCAY